MVPAQKDGPQRTRRGPSGPRSADKDLGLSQAGDLEGKPYRCEIMHSAFYLQSPKLELEVLSPSCIDDEYSIWHKKRHSAKDEGINE